MLLVTGSTGRIGGGVARRLAAADVPHRLFVRDAARAPNLPGTEVHVGAYGDRDATLRACAGVDTVFMVSGGEVRDRVAQHTAFVDAAVEAGVGHVVYLSFVGAAPDATFTLVRDHHATEEHIRARGVGWTFLRDNLYADLVPLLAGPDDAIRGPAGDGRAALVARDDVADVAAVVLRDAQAGHANRHVGAAYDLTGPEALTLDEAAHVAAAATGRPLRYVAETLEEAYASRAGHGAEPWLVEAWVSTYTAIAAGELARVSDAVERLTGRRPRTLGEVLGAAS